MTGRIAKHYFLVLFGIVYFPFYISYKDDFFVSLWEWWLYWPHIFSFLSAMIAVFTSYSILSIILRSTRKFIIHIWTRKESEVYPVLSGMALKFMSYANYVISFYIWFTLVIIPKQYHTFANKAVSTIFIFIALVVITNLIIVVFEQRRTLRFKFANNLSRHLSSIIKKILLVFVWIIWWITIVSNLGYDVSALIAWAWIGWLALALGAQKSLTNVFWAITIVLNKPFRIGDYVKIDNTIWRVKDIWISYLTIVDKAWHQVMIPNEVIMTSFVENYDVREHRRTDLTIGLEYNMSDSLMQRAVKSIEEVLEVYVQDKTVEKYRVNFDGFWEYSLNIIITYFSLEYKMEPYLKQKEAINLDIKSAFKENNIKIAFPTRNLIIKKKKK